MVNYDNSPVRMEWDNLFIYQSVTYRLFGECHALMALEGFLYLSKFSWSLRQEYLLREYWVALMSVGQHQMPAYLETQNTEIGNISPKIEVPNAETDSKSQIPPLLDE